MDTTATPSPSLLRRPTPCSANVRLRRRQWHSFVGLVAVCGLAAAGCVETDQVEADLALSPTSGPTGTTATVTVEATDADLPIELNDGRTVQEATLDDSGRYETPWEFVGEPGDAIVLELFIFGDDEILFESSATFTVTETLDTPLEETAGPIGETEQEDSESQDSANEAATAGDESAEDSARSDEQPADAVDVTVAVDPATRPDGESACRVTADDLIVEQFHDTDSLSPELAEANAFSSIRVHSNSCEFEPGTFFVSISDVNRSGTVDPGDAFFIAPQPAEGSGVEIGIDQGGTYFLGSISQEDVVTVRELTGTPFDTANRLEDGSGWQLFADADDVTIRIIERSTDGPTLAYYDVDFGDALMAPLP